jgi:hypothetical protein
VQSHNCADDLAPQHACAQDKPLEVRQSAGLLLKNNLRSWAGLNPLVQAYVKAWLGGARGRRTLQRCLTRAPFTRPAC